MLIIAPLLFKRSKKTVPVSQAVVKQKVLQPKIIIQKQKQVSHQVMNVKPSFVTNKTTPSIVEVKPSYVANKIAKKTSIPKKIIKQPTKIWAVQLASFSDKTYADNLVVELENKKFNAYVKETQGTKHFLYKVYVGPVKSRKQAENLAADLNKRFGLKGLVIRSTIS